jgi:hypothetical protein
MGYTAEPRGATGPAGAAGLASAASPPGRPALPGAVGPASWHDPSLGHLLSREQHLDERYPPRKRWFDPKVEARINGSTCLAVQPPQPSFRGDPRHP